MNKIFVLNKEILANPILKVRIASFFNIKRKIYEHSKHEDCGYPFVRKEATATAPFSPDAVYPYRIVGGLTMRYFVPEQKLYGRYSNR